MKQGVDLECDGCGAIAKGLALDMVRADKLGWDWFHGYLKRTHHFCPRCKNGVVRRERFAESQTP